jgi:hypothetical protein
MIINFCFLVAAVISGWFLGWRTGLEVVVLYVGCQVGANSPATFKNSKAGLQRIADSAAAKARVLAAKGKT